MEGNVDEKKKQLEEFEKRWEEGLAILREKVDTTKKFVMPKSVVTKTGKKKYINYCLVVFLKGIGR